MYDELLEQKIISENERESLGGTFNWRVENLDEKMNYMIRKYDLFHLEAAQ